MLVVGRKKCVDICLDPIECTSTSTPLIYCFITADLNDICPLIWLLPADSVSTPLDAGWMVVTATKCSSLSVTLTAVCIRFQNSQPPNSSGYMSVWFSAAFCCLKLLIGGYYSYRYGLHTFTTNTIPYMHFDKVMMGCGNRNIWSSNLQWRASTLISEHRRRVRGVGDKLLRGVYSSPIIVRVTESRKTRWAGCKQIYIYIYFFF
jgi:hypothetical protein